jgi:hypothetical protein
MDKEYREKRLDMIHEGKNYENNLNFLNAYKEQHPSVNIDDLNIIDGADDVIGQTQMIQLLTARDSVNEVDRKLDLVEKKHGKDARQAFEDYLINGKKQEDITNERNLGCLRTVKTLFKKWQKTALEIDEDEKD